MTNRLAQLETLLERVQRRASEPRPVRAVAAAEEPSTGPSEGLEMAAVQPEPEASTPEPHAAGVDSMDSADLGPSELEPVELDAPELDGPGGFDATATTESASHDLDEDDIVVEELDEDDLSLDEPAPESGQVAAELDAPDRPLSTPPESTVSRSAPPRGDGPTIEQVGQTVPLEEGDETSDLELDEPVAATPEPASSEQFEATLPEAAPEAAPTQDEQLPEDAREQLERHRLGDQTPIEARTSVRPVLSTNVVDLVSAAKEFEPKTFAELLDASLDL